MAINRFRLYVGPLGYLRALPGHPSSPEFAQALPGAEHRSLSGRTTFDISGRVRRGWNVTWQWLTEDEETWLQALYRRSASLDLRLMDPRKRNLLPEDVSTGGSSTLGVTAFTELGAGAVAWVPGGVPTDLTAIVAGYLNWTGLTAAQRLYGSSENTPMIAGSSYTFSVYAKGTTNIQLTARPFDQAGVEQAVVVSAGQAVTAAWQRYSWVYAPAAGIGSAQFGLSAVGAGAVQTTGWSVQVDDTLKAWTFGYGCPVVRVSPSSNGSYWRDKYHNASLQLLEV